MGTITIDFDILNDAVSKSRSVADELEDYANAFPGKVTNPLGSLTGGSSSLTSTAASLANNKAAELRKRSEDYRSLARKLEHFGKAAIQADKAVKDQFADVVKEREKGLNWWDRIATTLFRILNDALGDDVISQLIRDVLNGVESLVQNAIHGFKEAFNWFKHGNGRYVLETLVSILGAIGAVCTAIASFPVSGIFGIIMAAAAIVVAVDSVADAITTTIAAHQAFARNDTEPGRARYYGSATSYAEFAKRNQWPAWLQNLTTGMSKTADIAGLFVTVGNLFSYRGVKTEGSKVIKNPKTRRRVYQNEYKFDRSVVEMNLRKKFGWKADVYKKGVKTGLPKFDKNGHMKGKFSVFSWGLPKGSTYSPDKINELGSKLSYAKRVFSTTMDVTRFGENFARGEVVDGFKDLSKLAFGDVTKLEGPKSITNLVLSRIGE